MKENLGINMTIQKKNINFEKLPTLSDVLLVEKILQNSNESIITKTKLKKLINGKIKQNKLDIILDYLQERNKIFVSAKGITWIHNTSSRLRKEMDKILSKSELTDKDALEIGRKIKHGIAKQHGLVK